MGVHGDAARGTPRGSQRDLSTFAWRCEAYLVARESQVPPMSLQLQGNRLMAPGPVDRYLRACRVDRCRG